MFLNKSEIRWGWICVAMAIVAILCALSFYYFDIPMMYFMRKFNGEWAYIFDILFGFKSWVIYTICFTAIIFVKKLLERRAQSADVDIYKLKDRKLINDKYKQNTSWVSVLHHPSFYILCSVVFAGAIGGVLKILIGRARPIMFENAGVYGFFPPGDNYFFYSMPSGHTIASFAALVTIGLLFPRIKWLCWALAVLIGLSRLCYGAHYLGDVLLGAFIGMVVADLIVYYIPKIWYNLSKKK
ncbi:MAG: phosphatase PAP2 family protein [Rickettsiales bacterium]|jgi:membrane-associated phospholipid phosphatase|nr:phosphatase PAP2 family protein [Rickettsiales bacterium]